MKWFQAIFLYKGRAWKTGGRAPLSHGSLFTKESYSESFYEPLFYVRSEFFRDIDAQKEI